jgi:RNA polymerase-binding transcription factor DksA
MNDKQRRRFKEQLLELQHDVGSRAEVLAAAIAEQELPPGEHERRIVPACDTEPDWVAERAEEEMGAAILRALERIALGTYGTCAHCGGAIPLARLDAVPYAEFCVKCAAEME